MLPHGRCGEGAWPVRPRPRGHAVQDATHRAHIGGDRENPQKPAGPSPPIPTTTTRGSDRQIYGAPCEFEIPRINPRGIVPRLRNAAPAFLLFRRALHGPAGCVMHSRPRGHAGALPLLLLLTLPLLLLTLLHCWSDEDLQDAGICVPIRRRFKSRLVYFGL